MAVFQLNDRIAERNAQAFQDRRLQQEIAQLLGLTAQHLFG
jgi:hypothetical protein